GINNVLSFQLLVKSYMDLMVADSTKGFTTGGTENLDSSTPYLFMSNHRDISLDPAFIDYAMFMNNRETVRIAIGDNLLSKPYASDLMRINKSFIVKRSAIGRQMLLEYKKLSSYIRKSIEEDRHSIWIAQREGRAKDSLDRTEPAVIKMISLSRRNKEESLGEFIESVHLLPVSISYEWDPLDSAKALEQYHKDNDGEYKKNDHEDLSSIGLGYIGQKGAVNVHFGKPVTGEFENHEQVAKAVDKQVIGNYMLHPSNFIAYHRITGTLPGFNCGAKHKPFKFDDFPEEVKEFDKRLNDQPEYLHKYILDIYANPVVSRLALDK
ncbi:MAG: 1-acyl-sn-glycerol-3-phosphate acyltransferase, partial [Deltaproteobacteria bacterium]|nr:1-acyl-sn-glycerol-3-phosphate acyltransferase [Deltaproteobacteria bacterium]